MSTRTNRAALERAATAFHAMWLETASAIMSSDWYDEVSSTGAIESYQLMDGAGAVREWLGERQFKVPQVWELELKNKDWENSTFVPVNAVEDDTLGHYAGQVRMFMSRLKAHPDRLMAELLTGGFAANGYDGVPFFATSHPTATGTQSTRITGGSGTTLATAAFQNAYALLQGATDYAGEPLGLVEAPDAEVQLVVGPSNRATADSIVTVATTSSGAGNPNYSLAKVKVNPYLIGDYAAYWYLVVAKAPVRPFVLQVRRAPDVRIITDPDDIEVRNNRRIPIIGDGRWNAGYRFWQSIVGSNGA